MGSREAFRISCFRFIVVLVHTFREVHRCRKIFLRVISSGYSTALSSRQVFIDADTLGKERERERDTLGPRSIVDEWGKGDQ